MVRWSLGLEANHRGAKKLSTSSSLARVETTRNWRGLEGASCLLAGHTFATLNKLDELPTSAIARGLHYTRCEHVARNRDIDKAKNKRKPPYIIYFGSCTGIMHQFDRLPPQPNNERLTIDSSPRLRNLGKLLGFSLTHTHVCKYIKYIISI